MIHVFRLHRACIALATLAGCAPAPEQPGAAHTDDAVVQAGSTWQVEDIDRRGIVDRSMVTVQFTDDGRVAGSTGCNRYTGMAEFGGGQVSVSGIASTRRACVPALMNQEQRFLSALADVASYTYLHEAVLELADAGGAARLRMVGIPEDPTRAVRSGRLDASGASHRFDCGGAGTVTIRFDTHETAELRQAGTVITLHRERSASGARYAGDGTEFWNRGDEALFTVGDARYVCRLKRD